MPVAVAAFVGYVAEWITCLTGTPATLSRGSVFDACGTRYCSGEKARRILGYRPRVGIEEAIRMSCEVGALGMGQGVLLPKSLTIKGLCTAFGYAKA